MKTDDFIIEFIKKGGRIHETICGWRFTVYHMFAELTKYIDYSCNFNENGLCDNRRRQIKKKPTVKETRCCCYDCGNSMGYLRELPNDYNMLLEYARHFDRRNGFWLPSKGCILPRKLRSETCLTFACMKIEWSPAEKFLRECLRKKRRTPMTVNGHKCEIEYEVIEKLKKWLKENCNEV